MQAVRSMVLVSSDPQSMQAGAQEVYTRLQKEIQSFNLEKEISLSMINDIGRHDSIPMVIVYPEAVIYGPVKTSDVPLIVIREPREEGRLCLAQIKDVHKIRFR